MISNVDTGDSGSSVKFRLPQALLLKAQMTQKKNSATEELPIEKM